MNPADLDLLQTYLDGELNDVEVQALEGRLKSEPDLADQLLLLAREEATMTEWAQSMVVAASTLRPAGAAAQTVPQVHEERSPVTSRPLYRGLLAAATTIVLLLAVGVLLWNPPSPVESEATIARVEEVQGEVIILKPTGETSLAFSGAMLTVGQELRTGGDGSFASLRYDDGTLLELSTLTQVRLEPDGGEKIPDAGKRVFLTEGFVTADVSKQPLGRPMVLTTPHAVIRVLGTRFSSSALPEATRVELVEGRVRMTRTSDGQSIEVAEGRYAVAEAKVGPAPALVERFAPRPLPPRITRPRAELSGGPGPTMGVSLSPDGKHLAIAGWDGSVALWDWAALEIRLMLKGHTRQVRAHTFSSDSRLLVTGSNDKVVKVWGVTFGEEKLTLPKSTKEIDAIALSPDGATLAVSAGFIKGKGGAQLALWDVPTGQLKATLAHTGGAVSALAFSPDGKSLVGGARDGMLKIWNLARLDESVVVETHSDWINDVAFSPDGHWLATAGRDGRVIVWKTSDWSASRTLRGHTREVRKVVFSPDGMTLASCATDATARLWDVHAGREMLAIVAHKFAVTGLAFSPDGNTLITCGSDRMVKLWDLTQQEAVVSAAE